MNFPVSGRAVGTKQRYKGHKIQAWFYCPDFLCIVDGAPLSGKFFDNAPAAYRGGMRYIDEVEKENAQ